MSVRAKFKVQRFEATQYNNAKTDENGTTVKDERGCVVYEPVEMRTIVMSPVYGNGDPNHENTKFWKASPSGELKLGTINPEAWKQFELGKEYYIDFTPAE